MRQSLLWVPGSPSIVDVDFTSETRPFRVWTVYSHTDPNAPPILPLSPRHNDGFFLEDYTHDWSMISTHQMRYFSRVRDKEEGCWLLLEWKSTDILHTQAQELSVKGALLTAKGEDEEGRHLFREAALLEEKALQEVSTGNSRTRGILGVSLVALLYKGRELDRARSWAERLLKEEGLTERARQQLHDLMFEIDG